MCRIIICAAQALSFCCQCTFKKTSLNKWIYMYISESETLCRTRYLSITTFMITRQWLLVNQLSVQPDRWWVGTHKGLDCESVLAISQIITCGYTQKVSQLSLTHVRSQWLGLKTSGSKINMSLQTWPISFLLCPYPLYITG